MNTKYETKNLTLRVLNRQHSRLVYDFYSRNLLDFGSYEPINYEVASTLRYYNALLDAEQSLISEKELVRYYFFEKNNPLRIIGTASFRSFERSSNQLSCILGYKIDSDYRRLGYVTEALSLLCKEVMYKENIHRVNAYVMTDNLPSCRLLEKIGFSCEGTLRKSLRLNGVWHDEYLYALLDE